MLTRSGRGCRFWGGGGSIPGRARDTESMVAAISAGVDSECITRRAVRWRVMKREAFRRPASGEPSEGKTRILEIDQGSQFRLITMAFPILMSLRVVTRAERNKTMPRYVRFQ
jgi:hypothetical protein